MKILYVTTVGIMMRFFESFIGQLLEQGHTVDIATNEDNYPIPEFYQDKTCRVYHMEWSRSPADPGNITAIRRLRKLVRDNGYDIVHCHSAVASVCTRIACKGLRKQGTKVFYTAHGFYFTKGGSLKDWLLYYPVEWLCAWWTDLLITINEEDYALARKHMHAKRVEYVPGVGVDLSRFGGRSDREEKRRELGLKPSDLVLLSVGELIPRKNHRLVIEALAQLKDAEVFPRIQYLICGTGALAEELPKLAEQLGVAEHVHFLGFREDISAICQCSDLFVFMSLHEGLPVALMEAMACGLPAICSDIRGNNDLVENGVSGCVIKNNAAALAESMTTLLADEQLRAGYAAAAKEQVQRFDLESVNARMRDVYTDELRENRRGGVTDGLHLISEWQQFQKEHDIPAGAYILLSVGEVNRNKNQRLVIEALAKIKPLNIVYVICGQGPSMDELKCLSRELGVEDHVVFAGFQKNVNAIYSAADLFIFPSMREGLSVALMEAMASGVPVICSDIRGNTDLIEDGVSGRVIKNDSAQLASVIEELLADENTRKRYAAVAREKVRHFDLESVNVMMRDVYAGELIKTSGGV